MRSAGCISPGLACHRTQLQSASRSVGLAKWLLWRKRPTCCHPKLLGVVLSRGETTSTTDIASDNWEADLIARPRGDQIEEDDSSGDEGGIRRQLRPLQSPRKWPWDMWENLYRLRCSQMMCLWWKPSQNCRTLSRNTALNRLQWLSRSPLGTSSLPSDKTNENLWILFMTFYLGGGI